MHRRPLAVHRGKTLLSIICLLAGFAFFVASLTKGQPCTQALTPPGHVWSALPSPVHTAPQLGQAASAAQLSCLHASGFEWKPFSNTTSETGWSIMSLVETKASPSGFQRRCDWVLGSRLSLYGRIPHNSAWGDPSLQPRTIFVRSDLAQAFHHRVLPCLASPFVLLLGDNDITVPRQLDLRFRKVMEGGVWEALLADDRVMHVFVEHLDELHPRWAHKLSPLPTGINPYEFNRTADAILPHVPPTIADIVDRPLTVLQADRTRKGPQWDDRRHVHDLCLSAWNEVCVSNSSAPGPPFWDLLRQHSFIICVHGGGLDPNPKLWEALLLGTIPIVAHFPGIEAYRGLPVVIVDAWTREVLSDQLLRTWREQLAPHFINPAQRVQVLQQLHADYWWSKVEAALEGRLAEFDQNITRRAIPWKKATLGNRILFPTDIWAFNDTS